MTNYPLDTRVSHLESDMGATAHEMQKLNTFWVEKYNQLQETVKNMAHAMQVAIGVRNTKIKELTGKVQKLDNRLLKLEQTLEALQ